MRSLEALTKTNVAQVGKLLLDGHLAAQIVGNVTPGQLTRPTPCAEFDVRALANHMTGFLTMTEQAARKAPMPSPGSGSGSGRDVTGDGGWTTFYAEQARKAAAAWADPAAWQGSTEFGPGRFPAEVAGSITLMELVVHGWDLARATGQVLHVDGDVAEAAYRVVSQIAGNARANGSFAEPVPVPDTASPLERALAASGRDPHWAPSTV